MRSCHTCVSTAYIYLGFRLIAYCQEKTLGALGHGGITFNKPRLKGRVGMEASASKRGGDSLYQTVNPSSIPPIVLHHMVSALYCTIIEIL